MPRRNSNASTGRTTPLSGTSDEATTEISIGCYAIMPGRSAGRIVDKSTRNGAVWWLVKLTNGELLWARTSHLSPI